MKQVKDRPLPIMEGAGVGDGFSTCYFCGVKLDEDTTGREHIRPSPKSHVKIVRTPAGEAPLKIRREWLGLILPCDPVMGLPEGRERGAISGKPIRPRIGVSVLQSDAIAALERACRHKAVRYWKKHGYPRYTEGDDCFGFAEGEVQVLKPPKGKAVCC